MLNERNNEKSVTFVSDWQKRTSRKQIRFNLILIGILAIAFLSTALFFIWSKNKNHELIVDNNMKYLQICGEQEADRVEDTFSEGVMLISNLANRYTAMIENLPPLPPSSTS